MDDKILVLMNSMRRDLEAIAAIYDELGRPLEAETDSDTLIVIAYYLHNLYNAFENVFQNIAAVFENAADDVERWHTQLLERMRMDVMPLRPAVIDDAAYDALDELRRFRHLFRHAYSVKLDPLRLQLVMRKAFALKAIYVDQLEQFVDFLQDLVRE
jgi:hypothetical protein